jgi:transcriptional regulator with XRE-family HTH domain
MVMIVASAELATPVEIGARVQYFRRKKGLSLEVAAGLAGISPSYLARLEGGKRQFNRRGLLETLALVVGCSVTDLTDPDADSVQSTKPKSVRSVQSVAKSDPVADAVIPQLETALYDCSLDVPDVPCRPVRELVAAARLANERRMEAGRYDLAGHGLGALLTELHVAAVTAKDSAEQQAALAALVETSMVAADVASTFGDWPLAVLAAEHGREAAARLGNPALIGFAGWTSSSALWTVGAHRRAVTGVTAVIDGLAGVDPTGSDTLAAEAYGFAHLRRGLLAARMGQANTAFDHLGEAGRIASLTGERNGLRQHFGPSNVAIWRLTIGVELQEAGKAYERATAASIDPARLGANRTMSLHLNLGRALAQEGGRRDADAARHLDLAARHGPHRVRHLPMARDLFAELDKRAPQKSWLLESLRNQFGGLSVSGHGQWWDA